MPDINYMKQGQNGQITMLCSQLPDKGFINAVKVRDICKARFLTRQEKAELEPGSPDIRVVSATGEQYMITRKQLVQNFTLPSGKKIILAYLKSGNDYIVCTNCNKNYKVLLLPDNCCGEINGRKVKSGNYLVIPVDESGSLDRKSMGVVSGTNFRKMFKIPMQDVISRHLNGKGSKQFTLFKQYASGMAPKGHNISLGNSKLENNGFRVNINKQPSQNVKQPITANATAVNKNPIHLQKEAESKYRFTVLNRLMDMNNKAVGFTVKEIKTGNTRQLTTQELSKLCEMKLVDNVMIVKKEQTGQKYLKGNGIIINNLPKILV